QHRLPTRSWLLPAALVLAVLSTACTRAADDLEVGASAPVSDEVPASEVTDEPDSTGAGDFGDLEGVCGPGDASGATDQGVTDEAVQVGTIADPGFDGRPGLNQEIFDAAEVFVQWCNEAGGINGRRIEVELRDAKLSEYK